MTKNAVYTGEKVTPEIRVTANLGNASETTKLSGSRDYTVAYSNNVEVGTEGEYTITGKGNYTGEISGNFEIEKHDLSADDITVTISNGDTYKAEVVRLSGMNSDLA